MDGLSTYFLDGLSSSLLFWASNQVRYALASIQPALNTERLIAGCVHDQLQWGKRR